MRILWSNFPIPEPFLVALITGGVLQVIIPVRLFTPSNVWIVTGSILIIAGLAIATWAVFAARDNNLAQPTALVTGGPYAFSRNPMYLSWGFVALGQAFLFNALWLAIATLVALIYIHTATIPREEQALQLKFSPEFDAYRKLIRRWL